MRGSDVMILRISVDLINTVDSKDGVLILDLNDSGLKRTLQEKVLRSVENGDSRTGGGSAFERAEAGSSLRLSGNGYTQGEQRYRVPFFESSGRKFDAKF
ncbi:hypothetical protein D3C71_1903610 [compost metagenome]